MSSRALRKLQKEKEQQEQSQNIKDDASEESDEETIQPPKPSNAFDMLNDDGGGDEEVESASDNASEEHNAKSVALNYQDQPVALESPRPKAQSKKKKSKKKGKGTKQTAVSRKDDEPTQPAQPLDEIDIALQSLSMKAPKDASPSEPSAKASFDEAEAQLYRLLAIESKHLNAMNEMKRMFGNVVMENDREDAAAPRRRGRGPQELDLGAALLGRNSPVSHGQGLAGLALRRNPFILGKDAWPKATSGGLGMELVEKLEDGTTEFRFVHNTMYQDVQRQFEVFVSSLDDQNLISLLQYNPYHVSTLLQVSEIAEHQGDHSVSGDLLERALFSFGRSVMSSFTTALSEGKARLDFRRPENREFWLTAWRYIQSLGKKGTWRTAYEWAKLTLALDPEGDPYRIGWIIDQIALRGGQSEHFLKLHHHLFMDHGHNWAWHPNVPISAALAEFKLKHAQASRRTLAECMDHFPWVFARLFQELNIDRVPKSIWGKMPDTDRDKLESEMYVESSKDLWNAPETVSLLVEVAESIDGPGKESSLDAPDITRDEARHVMMTGKPSLIKLIPRSFTRESFTSADPLPPRVDNLPSYHPLPQLDRLRGYVSPFEMTETTEDPETSPNEEAQSPDSPVPPGPAAAEAQPSQGLAGFFRGIIPWRRRNEPVGDGGPVVMHIDEQLQRAIEQNGPPPELGDEPGQQIRDEIARSGGNPPPEREEEQHEHADRLANVLETPPEAARDGGEEPEPEEGPHDKDERHRRWLAGAGLLKLKAFTDRYGTDEKAWMTRADDDIKELSYIVDDYALRMFDLSDERQRIFLLDFTLRQGAGEEQRNQAQSENKHREALPSFDLDGPVAIPVAAIDANDPDQRALEERRGRGEGLGGGELDGEEFEGCGEEAVAEEGHWIVD
ncbi:hypothetical protein ACLMJK_007139 [Lecanora helva]